jgi:superfamily II DNA or RNA helicase
MEIKVTKLNHTFLHVDCEDRGILQELSDHLTFDVPGAKFHPKVKMKIWDGKIRLFSLQKRQLYAGLYDNLREWAENCKYALQVIDSKRFNLPNFKAPITPEQIHAYVDSLNVHSKGKKLEIRDYQYIAIYNALKNRNATTLAPTGSGKSLIQYCILRYLLDQEMRCMLVVPTTALVLQMINDFKDYSSENGWDVDSFAHITMAGREKVTDKLLQCTTWQSVYKESSNLFNTFDCICVDECHLCSAASLTGIMEKATEVPYRFGFTGSLDNSKTNRLVIQGLFGPVTKVTSTKKLMDELQQEK